MRSGPAWILTGLVALSACGGDGAADSSGGRAPRPEITAAELRNAGYPSQYVEEGTIRLTARVYEDPDRRVAVLLQPEYAVGDLDGDGSPDAAVVLATNTGGSGTFTDLCFVPNDGPPVRSAACRFLGDRVLLDRVRIVDGIVELDVTMHGPADPMCCPTLELTRRFRLTAGELIEIEPPPGAPDYVH